MLCCFPWHRLTISPSPNSTPTDWLSITLLFYEASAYIQSSIDQLFWIEFALIQFWQHGRQLWKESSMCTAGRLTKRNKNEEKVNSQVQMTKEFLPPVLQWLKWPQNCTWSWKLEQLWMLQLYNCFNRPADSGWFFHTLPVCLSLILLFSCVWLFPHFRNLSFSSVFFVFVLEDSGGRP